MSAIEKFTAAPWVMGTAERTQGKQRETVTLQSLTKESDVSGVVRPSAGGIHHTRI